MEVAQAILHKRAVRQFMPGPLPPEAVRAILNAGRRAQSSKNTQPWRFVAVQDRVTLEALSLTGSYAGHLAGAALGVAILTPDPARRWSILFDAGQAAAYMQLAAWEIGIGSCLATIYDRDKARTMLGVPADLEIHVALSFGYPADPAVLTAPPRAGGRMDAAEVIRFERWDQNPTRDDRAPHRDTIARMSIARRGLPRFLALLAATLLLTSVGPPERLLGNTARVVYLHGAWVWSALIGLLAAGALGLIGLILRDVDLQRWSMGWGRSGAAFWLTSLPLSLWAMQTSWNGLYLAEPRWQVGVRFAVVAILLQMAISLIRRPAVAAALNGAFFAALAAALLRAESVMHPPAPIGISDWRLVQAYFLSLLLAASLAALQLAAIARPRR